MITKFKLFEYMKKPQADEKTIRVEGLDRGWYIDFYFNDENKLIYVDNKWHIKFPDWYGFNSTIDEIRYWAKRYDSRCEVYYLLKNDLEKYNL